MGVWIWNAQTKAYLRPLMGHQGDVTDVAFSPDGKRIVSVGMDDTARLWNAKTGGLLNTLRGMSVLCMQSPILLTARRSPRADRTRRYGYGTRRQVDI